MKGDKVLNIPYLTAHRSLAVCQPHEGALHEYLVSIMLLVLVDRQLGVRAKLGRLN